MAGDQMDAGEGYSATVGLVYIFNLIVGTGALTMPAAFSHAGWMLSLVILIAIAFMSFLTVTFVVEAMAVANAMVHWRTVQHIKKVINEEEEQMHAINTSRQDLVKGLMRDEVISNSIEHDEKVPLLLSNSMDSITDTAAVEYYSITERIELGKMASLFFNKFGVNIFYLCIAVYLYGDLAIYAAAVSVSLRDVTCNYVPPGNACNISYTDWDLCWTSVDYISRKDAYRIYLAVFLCLLGPFAFFNVQKTKYLQVITSVMRWLAFGSMIILAAIALVEGKSRGHPEVANLNGIPNLFGVCVYSFMCHHSLPSLITPIRSKKNLTLFVLADFFLILGFYSLLCFTGIFTFSHLKDMYTLNFQPEKCGSGNDRIIIAVPFLQYFLALFPVFTLSTNFPIIAITLRNNLKALFLKDTRQYSFFLKGIFFPLVTILPPVAIALATEDLEILVGITGSYAGAIIQYIVPATLVYYARKDALTALGLGVKNKHMSPFHHTAWIIFVLVWSAACIIFVTVNHIITKK
ncbi:transmembrane protein 104-like isoform X2 [Centruroides sculpturatus]|uniref:transmembrane protein 104-like isoform X2 n=1 Tax=Centruroides sculpturatus TaxID=218467 RepID=UPI000C6E7799|nr:transmembrane protein 104-like isoform X2 [Centruroides sculpturatus]